MVSELNVDEVVRRRYATGARERQESLCCPVSYDPRYLEIIPREIVERDYGCGSPHFAADNIECVAALTVEVGIVDDSRRSSGGVHRDGDHGGQNNGPQTGGDHDLDEGDTPLPGRAAARKCLT